MYECKYYGIHELVYPKLYKEYEKLGRLDSLWAAIDERILVSADRIRELVNTSVTINNWKSGGDFIESGLREFDTETGASLSQHKFGRALDPKFNSSKWDPEKLRLYMKSIGCFEPDFRYRTDDEAKPFVFIHRIEWRRNKPMGWFHMDVSPLYPDDGSIGIVWI